MILEILLWTSVGAIAYSYCLYPLILLAGVKMRGSSTKQITVANDLPLVSLVVSAYNESAVLEDKIRNMIESDYPSDKIEYIVGSDGSTDRTPEILDRLARPNLKPFIFKLRRGKAAVLNELVANSVGDILIFTDANTMFARDTIRLLVSRLSEKEIGGVCGEMILQNEGISVGGFGESTYWNYENVLKDVESNFQTIIGATGGVYAIRRSLFRSLPTNKVVVDDFLIPVQVVTQGYSMVYEPKAHAYEKISGSVGGEFKRRVRISAANFHGFSEFSHLLHPRYRFVAFSLWSHKIVRWRTPFLLIAIFILTMLLGGQSPLYRGVLIAEWIVIGLGLLGFLAERFHVRIGFLGFPYYFMAMNGALLVGFLKFLVGKQRPTWDIIR